MARRKEGKKKEQRSENERMSTGKARRRAKIGYQNTGDNNNNSNNDRSKDVAIDMRGVFGKGQRAPQQINHGYGWYGYGGYGPGYAKTTSQTTAVKSGNGSTTVHHQTHTAVQSDSWWGDGGLCLGITVFVFIFIFVFILIAGLSQPYQPYPYHGSYPVHPHLSLVGKDARGKGQCSTGEQFSHKYKQCLPRELHPVSLDRSIQDRTAGACQDFDKYSCGKWQQDHNHGGQSRSFTYIDNKNQFDVRSIVLDEKVEGVNAFYQSCVDTLVRGKHTRETVEERDHEMRKILDSLKTEADLPVVFGLLLKNAYTAPLGLQIENHPLKPKMVPMLRYDGFPDDLDDNSMLDLLMATTPTRYEARGKLLLLKDALRKLQRFRPDDIEDYVAYATGDGLKRDMMTWAEFKRTAFGGSFQWNSLLQTLDGHQLRFENNQEVWISGRQHFEQIKLGDLSMREWKAYVEFSILYHTESFFPDLPSNVFFRKAHPMRKNYRYPRMERHKRQRRLPRAPVPTKGAAAKRSTLPDTGVTPEDCLRATQFLLPGLVSKEFLSRGFHDERAMARVKQVVEDVKEELAVMQAETPYIDQVTRDKIVKKTKAIKVRVAHPTRWNAEPFAKRITKDRYLRNLDMIREYRVQRDLELWKRGGKLDRDEAARFQGPLSTVNAWYSPVYNVITLYPGILRYPFFHPNFDDASVFAGIGMVAGHELGHNGDSNGVLFDENGSVHDLWDKAAEAQLKKQFSCVEREYDGATPVSCARPGYGKQVLGEAAADRTGIEVAYRAWEKRLPGGKATKQQAQDFFGSYAQTWCASYTPDQQCDRVKNDVHPLPNKRVVNTLRNFPKFQWAFNCKDTDPMVHKPSCAIYGNLALPITKK